MKKLSTKTTQKIVWCSWKDMRNPLAGGAEVVAHELLNRLVAAGHEVILLTANYPGASDEPIGDYKIIRVGSRVSVYAAAWRYYRKHLKGWATLVIDECNTVPFFAGWYSGTRTVMLFHMLCRKIWFYELPQPLSSVGWLVEPIYLRLLKRGQVITVSESTKTDLLRNGFKANDISIISEGISTKRPAKLPTKTLAHPILLSLGSMRSMKQTLQLIQAFELAKDHVPGLTLEVAGDTTGAYGAKVMNYIESSRYTSSITVHGRVSNVERQRLMQQATAVLITSVKEGWGLVVSESNAVGTPAIVYNTDGLRDSVQADVTGLVCAPNPAAMAAAIQELLHDETTYQTLRTAAFNDSARLTFDQTYQDFTKALAI